MGRHYNFGPHTGGYLWVRGSSFECSCGYKWGYANVSVAQARREGLHKCPQCGRVAQGKAKRTNV